MKSPIIRTAYCLIALLLSCYGPFAYAQTNTPPDPPTGIQFVPTAPYASANLSAVIIGGNDTDGDPVTPLNNWYVNNQLVSTDHVLSFVQFTAGDIVSLEARFSDGTDISAPTSHTIIIAEGNDWIEASNLALNFDGQNDSVYIPSDPSLDLRSSLTLSAWVKNNGDNDGIIIWRGDSQGGHDPYMLHIADNHMEFRMDTGAGPLNEHKISSPQPVDAEWHCWAGVFDAAASELRLYLDGNLVTLGSTSETISYDTAGMWNMLGAVDAGGWQNFAGAIDEVRIWSYARTMDEIRNDLQRQLNGNEMGLVGYWRCDEGAGQTLTDSSLHGNDGILGANDSSGADDPKWISRRNDPGVHYFWPNKHHYEQLSAVIEVYWPDARAWAESRYYLGVQGHLATITDQQENDYIVANFVNFPSRGMHIGGFQPDGSPEPDGNWQWITGEPWTFTNWGPGEPNNNGRGPEGFLTVQSHTMWNDITADDPHSYYLVEYDTFGPAEHIDCGDVFDCFVDQQYADLLERVLTSGERQAHLDALCSGSLTMQGLAQNLINSSEFVDTTGFIYRCYFGIFNDNFTTNFEHQDYRVPELAGSAYWLAQLNSYDNLPDGQMSVVLGFTSSPEWQLRVGDLSAEEFVDFLYQNILGRSADPAGKQAHLDKLNSGAVTTSSLTLDFLLSGEAVNKYHNQTVVAAGYLNLLVREIARGQFAELLRRMEDGALDTADALWILMFDGPDYQDRLADRQCNLSQLDSSAVSFDLANSHAVEDSSLANLAVSVSHPPQSAITIDYAVTGGSASGGGIDYAFVAGTLTFNVGQALQQTIPLTLMNDNVGEPHETVIVTLSNPSANALIWPLEQHTFTIDNDDSITQLQTNVSRKLWQLYR